MKKTCRCQCGHFVEEYDDCDEDEFHLHNGFSGVKNSLRHRREELLAASKASKSEGSGTKIVSQRNSLPHTAAQESAAALSALSLKVCAHCNSGGNLMICTGCRAAYYCSKEHQSADWRNGHKEVCKAGGSRASAASSTPTEAEDRPLDLEMLELLNLFKSVHKDMPEENKEGTLRKVIHVCELIIKRGNPDNIPIPQVFYMLQEARQMLRPFILEKEGIYEPDEPQSESEPDPEPEFMRIPIPIPIAMLKSKFKSQPKSQPKSHPKSHPKSQPKPRSRPEPKPKPESKPCVETSDKQQSIKQTTLKKKSGERARRVCT